MRPILFRPLRRYLPEVSGHPGEAAVALITVRATLPARSPLGGGSVLGASLS